MSNNLPVPTNPATLVVNPVIDVLFKAATKMAENAVLAAFPPVTANPIVQFIDDEAIEYFAKMIYENFAKMVGFQIINYQVSGQVSDSKKTLAALEAAQKAEDPSAIAKALSDFQAATQSLTHFDGVSRP